MKRFVAIIAALTGLVVITGLVPGGPRSGTAVATPAVAISEVQVNAASSGRPPTQTNFEPSIAQNPTNRLNLLVGAFHLVDVPECTDATPSICPTDVIPASGMGFFASFDGGKTFPCQGALDFLAAGVYPRYDPWVAFDSRGNAYYAALAIPYPPEPGQFLKGTGMFVAKSTDGGCTWGPPVKASGKAAGQIADKDALVADSNSTSPFRDNVYATWLRESRTHFKSIMFSRSTDGGATWSEPIPLTSSSDNKSFRAGSLIQVGPDGTVYVVWLDQILANATLKLSISYDGGKTFAKQGLTVAADNDEQLFGDPRPGTNLLPADLPSFSVAPDGTLYVAWPSTTNYHSVVMLAKSATGGLSWAAPVVAADVNGRSAFMVAVAADASGVNVVFNAMDDVPSGTPLGGGVVHYDGYWVQSTDGGVTFGSPLPIASVSSDPDASAYPYYFPAFAFQDVGDYIAAVADGSHVYAVWTDTRNSSACTAMDAFMLGEGPPPDVITQCPANWDNADIYLGTVTP